MADTEEPMFPPGCNCDRLDVGMTGDLPGTKFIRGRSDPPCRVHLPIERSIYDAGHQRGFSVGWEAGVAYAGPDHGE